MPDTDRGESEVICKEHVAPGRLEADEDDHEGRPDDGEDWEDDEDWDDDEWDDDEWDDDDEDEVDDQEDE